MADWEQERSSSGYRSAVIRTLAVALLGATVLAGCTWSRSQTTGADTIGDDTVGGDTVDGTTPTVTAPAEDITGVVVFVIDGDTIDMEIDGQRERVRLLGIDAPESVSRSVPVQCFGQESSAALTELVPPGTELQLVRDIEARDRYGRLLLYLYRAEDGLFINEWLVREGLADTSFYEPNKTLAPTLTEARGQARAEGAGLWGQCDGPDQPLE